MLPKHVRNRKRLSLWLTFIVSQKLDRSRRIVIHSLYTLHATQLRVSLKAHQAEK